MTAGQLISRLEKAHCDARVSLVCDDIDIGDVIITVSEDDTEVVHLKRKEKTV